MINQTAKKILKALSFDGVEVEAFRHMADLKRLDPMKIFYKKVDEKIYNGSHAVPIRIFFPSEKNDTPFLVPRPVFLEMVMPSLAGLLSAILKTPSDIGYLLIFHCTQCTYDIIHRFTLNFKQIHR